MLIALLSAPMTHASERRSADSEYARGKAALKAGDATTALEAFKRGLALTGDDEGSRWQLVLAIGLTYEEGGQPHHAVEYYQRFLNQSEEHRDALSPKWHKRRQRVQGDITRLEKAMATSFGYLTVASEPTGVQVFIDGRRAGADEDAVTPVGVYLHAGEHKVSVRLAGHKLAEKTFELIAGKIRPLRFVLEPESLESAPPIDDAKADPLVVSEGAKVKPLDAGSDTLTLSATPQEPSRLGPWMLVGTGGLLAIGAAVTVGLASATRSDWTAYTEDLTQSGAPSELGGYQDADTQWSDYQSEAQTYDILTGVLGGAAALGIGAGLVWLLLDEDAPERATQFGLHPTPGGAAASAQWSF